MLASDGRGKVAKSWDSMIHRGARVSSFAYDGTKGPVAVTVAGAVAGAVAGVLSLDMICVIDELTGRGTKLKGGL